MLLWFRYLYSSIKLTPDIRTLNVIPTNSSPHVPQSHTDAQWVLLIFRPHTSVHRLRPCCLSSTRHVVFYTFWKTQHYKCETQKCGYKVLLLCVIITWYLFSNGSQYHVLKIHIEIKYIIRKPLEGNGVWIYEIVRKPFQVRGIIIIWNFSDKILIYASSKIFNLANL